MNVYSTREELETQYLRALAAADMKVWRAHIEHMRDLIIDHKLTSLRATPKSDAGGKESVL